MTLENIKQHTTYTGKQWSILDQKCATYYFFRKTEMMKTNMSRCNGSKIYTSIFQKNVFAFSQCVYKLEMLYLIRNIEGGKKFPGHPTREKLSGSWAYYFLGVYILLGPPSILFSA